MLYAVLFEDNPDTAHVRDQHMSDHLAFLERNSSTIFATGPLRDTADNTPAGGLWLVEADDAAKVATLYQQDPFWPTGLRRSVRVLQWRQVFRDGKRCV